MAQPQKSIEEIREIVSQCKFRDREFALLTPQSGEIFLQLRYYDGDVDSGKCGPQHGRKWRLSRYMTTSEITQTAFKAVITSQEHVAREFFRYRGYNVYGPHYDVDRLVELCQSEQQHLDVRA